VVGHSQEKAMSYHGLNSFELLHFAAVAVPVLKTLKATDTTMVYKDFGKAIGLVKDDNWEPAHRHQIATILNIIGAIDKKTGDEPLYQLVVNAATGEPGSGLNRQWEIQETTIT
jgi:hypothetical protein